MHKPNHPHIIVELQGPSPALIIVSIIETTMKIGDKWDL